MTAREGAFEIREIADTSERLLQAGPGQRDGGRIRCDRGIPHRPVFELLQKPPAFLEERVGHAWVVGAPSSLLQRLLRETPPFDAIEDVAIARDRGDARADRDLFILCTPRHPLAVVVLERVTKRGHETFAQPQSPGHHLSHLAAGRYDLPLFAGPPGQCRNYEAGPRRSGQALAQMPEVLADRLSALRAEDGRKRAA